MTLFLFPFIIVAGLLQAMGNSMNAQLNASLRNPWLASLLSFALITCFFLVAFSLMPRPLPTLGARGGARGSGRRRLRPDVRF